MLFRSYDSQDWEYVGLVAEPLQAMRNLTYDRLHTNGQKALYPTFVNAGDKPAVEGDIELMTIQLRAKRPVVYQLTPVDGLLIDKHLNSISF